MTLKRPKTKTVQCGFCNRLRPAKDLEWDRGIEQWVCRDADGCAAANLRKIHRAASKPNDATRPPASPEKKPAPICACCGKPGRRDRTIHRDGFGDGPEVPLCSACADYARPTETTIWKNIKLNRDVATAVCSVLDRCESRCLDDPADREVVAGLLTIAIIKLRIKTRGLSITPP
jgi:hypothetical protein